MNTSSTLFWYDLETSGINPREDRVMQFAGQRTTLELEPVGDPVNVFITMSNDILPQPDAILLTGITPQQTINDGVTEAAFLKKFCDEIAVPGTIFVGFNTIRFDDEFMRYLQYRNFYDPYVWQWKEDRGRWDLLDVVRMTRALRPEGMHWPVVDGKPGNRLELLTKANNIPHDGAHDALADVVASIEIAKLIRKNQPKLFTWLLKMRDKSQVKALVETGEPFVYSSGKYANDTEKTTVAAWLAEHPKKQGALVYDLRTDPTEFLTMDAQALAERWRWTADREAPPRLPVKTMQFNRCPAVAPLSVLDEASQQRIRLSPELAQTHLKIIKENPSFKETVVAALALLDVEQGKRQKTQKLPAEAQLYDGFFDTHDSNLFGVVRAAQPNELTPELAESFHDKRLKTLLARYKARNYPTSLTPDERTAWEAHRHEALLGGGQNSQLAKFMHRLGELAQSDTSGNKRFLLEELQLYAESIMPSLDEWGS